MITNPQITIVLGTARKNRQSDKVADYIFNYFKNNSKSLTVLADVKDFVTPYTIAAWDEDEAALPWRGLVKKTEVFIFVNKKNCINNVLKCEFRGLSTFTLRLSSVCFFLSIEPVVSIE